ncbi:unnamed protein product [Larinioides sclopetarius]|uniref:Uncharacterized protein n=1 Tax=Larinioides sclopetarius TaxID=280406 RepID=A0AAV1Z312_9ARAC
MFGRKRFGSDMTYVPDDISDTDSSSDSDSEYIDDIYSGTDENFSDSSVDSDESENSFSIQNARQWCKIDMQKIFHQLLLHFLLLAIPDQISLWQMMQLFWIILNFF